jgi:F-type H+-transporting ATPase subunit b
MPQITQLSIIFASQLFWLAVVFGILFFGIARNMVPKIQSTVDEREKKIAGDLASAQAARGAAEATEAAYREAMDASRAESAALTREARAASARDTEAKVHAAAEKIAAQVAKAEGKIRAAADAARAEIEKATVQATQDMVAKLTGIKIGREEAAAAVKAEEHG